MIAFLIFYWLFSALFMCGWISQTPTPDWRMYVASFLIGGIAFPMLLGLHLSKSLDKKL